jgi:4-hydroxy-3-methylbut-2-enyl diphosphate reductase
VDVPSGSIRHQPIGTKSEVVATQWLGDSKVIGITAGASTPNNKVGQTIARISAVAGVDLERELG